MYVKEICNICNVHIRDEFHTTNIIKQINDLAITSTL